MPLDSNDIDQLLNEIEEERLVRDLQAMIATPSVNPFDEPVSENCRELEFADLFETRMAETGLDTFRRDVVSGRPNVFGRRRGAEGGPCLMFAGHLDTVGVEGYEDPFNPVLKDGRIHGRGSCDMKAAMAAYLEVSRILHLHNIPLGGDLLVVGVADEEHKMIGSKEISLNGPRPELAIVGEPTELEVCHAHKGQLCMHIRTFGKATHSSRPELGINAISHMGQVIRALDDYAGDLRQRSPHPVCGHGRVNPGVIRGGSISSTVPDFCELEVDRRLLPGETREDLEREYRSLLDPIAQATPDFRYEIGEPTLEASALDTPVDHEIVRTVAGAVEETLRAKASVGALGGATDAPNFHCPAVICGPGSLSQAHTLNEYVPVSQLVDATRVYLRATLALLN